MKLYLVWSKPYLAACTLREAYKFLQELQAKGIKSASVLGTRQTVYLNEDGFWIWSAQDNPLEIPISSPPHFNGTTEPECPDCTMNDA